MDPAKDNKDNIRDEMCNIVTSWAEYRPDPPIKNFLSSLWNC